MADAVAQVYDKGSKRVVAPAVDIAANQGSYGVASGGAATVTCTPPTGKKAGVAYIDFGYRVAPTTGSIQISDGTTVWGPFTVLLGGLQTRTFNPPLMFKLNGQITVTLADGSQTKDLFAMFVQEGQEQPYA